MLELLRYPACVLSCHTLVEDPGQLSMSDRKYSGSTRDVASKTDRRNKNTTMRDHRHARSSADDPTISSTRSSKHVSSNARTHPRAELRETDTPHKGSRISQGSPVSANHVSNETNGGRKRSCEDEEDMEGSVWVEHTSSSGRIYYYNKKNGVSQWERPASMSKRTKTDESHSKRITPSSKHSSHPHASSSTHSHSSHSHPHSGSSSTSSTAHLHSHTSSSHTHGNNKEFMSSSHHRSLTHHTIHSSSQTYLDRVREKEQRDRSRTSHQRSNRGSRSSSKSTSVSPTTGSRGHGHHDKTTPNRHSRTHASSGSNKRGSLSPNVTPNKPSQTGSSTVSPGIPHDISQSLVATQQVINQTSAIIKHQQKLLSASGDPMTPVKTHSSHSPTLSSTKHTPHSNSRQKRLFSGQQQHANGPSSQYSATGGSVTPVHNSAPHTTTSTELSPQIMGMENLHPLQRALLLQQQQQQQQDILPGQSTPGTPLPSSGGGGATPISQSIQAVTPPISALPLHVASQLSHPGSPYSPSHTPSFNTFNTPPGVNHHMVPSPYTPQGFPPGSQTPVYPYVMMPANTPIAGIYMADGGIVPAGVPGRGGGAYVTTGNPMVTMRPPMSRLGRRRCSSTDEFSAFPDPSQVESVASVTNPALFNRSLAESWWSPTIETLFKQLDNSRREILSRRTTESLYLQGRLRRAQLSLDSTQFRTTTRKERLLALERLMAEIDQR